MAADSETSAPTIDELRAQTYGFDDHPLEHFRGLTPEDIEAHPGIGPKTRDRILIALAELAALEPAAPEPAPAEPDAGPQVAEDSVAEPALEPAERGGGPAFGLIALAVLAVLLLAVFAVRGNKGGYTYERELRTAREQLTNLTASSEQIAALSVEAGREQAQRLYQRAGEGNFGLALEHLAMVRTTLSALQSTRTEQVEFQELVSAALGRAEAAQSALMLSQPQTQEQVEAACQELLDAVAALAPQEARE